MDVRRSPNHLLSSLSPTDFELVRPHLQPADLPHEAVLATIGERMTRIYFPTSGMISLVTRLSNGDMIEVAMVGHDSVFGAAAALNGRMSLTEAIVQLPGDASVIDVGRLRAAAAQSDLFRRTLIRHSEFVMAQAQQTAACNAAHALPSRLARWLLRARDLSGSDNMALTQEFLGQMLGAQRSSVSVIANTLHKAGLIDYSRGRIEITNLEGLTDASCECYEAVKMQHDRLMNGD